MAKSSYLDNLLKGNIPNTPRSIYINNLWRETNGNKVSPPTSSIFTNLSNDIDIILMNSSYLYDLTNTYRNNLVVNMNSTAYSSNITLNNNFLPIAAKNKMSNAPGSDKYDLTITAPPDYLPAMITRTTNGMEQIQIPVLFPKSFSRSIQASFAKESPVGSDVPIVAYSYTNAESIPLEFDVISDYLPTKYKNLGLNAYIEDIISILKPKKTNSTIYEPTVMVSFADISFRGICESISINYDNLYDYKSFTHAIINCQFTKLD